MNYPLLLEASQKKHDELIAAGFTGTPDDGYLPPDAPFVMFPLCLEDAWLLFNIVEGWKLIPEQVEDKDEV